MVPLIPPSLMKGMREEKEMSAKLMRPTKHP
jgi:hypothetical protein